MIKEEKLQQKNDYKDKWMLSFSGFLLLLFAVFVVLFATVQTKNKELEAKVKTQEKESFQKTDVSSYGFLMSQVQSKDISTEITDRGLEVRFLVADFYPDKAFIPHADVLPVIDRFGLQLKELGVRFTIIGHADVSEVGPEGDLKLWELTALRAAWIAERWKKLYSLDLSKLTVSSRLFYEPKAQSETEKSAWIKNQNKRVEVILHPAKGVRS